MWHARVPKSASCANASCWREKDLALSVYRDRTGASDGIVAVTLRNGLRGDGDVVVAGQGPNLQVPSLPLGRQLRMQLRSDNGKCWEARYDAASIGRSDTRRFRAVGAE